MRAMHFQEVYVFSASLVVARKDARGKGTGFQPTGVFMKFMLVSVDYLVWEMYHKRANAWSLVT
eukprot:11222097-Lingulodinium_polyedra.AAC.1